MNQNQAVVTVDEVLGDLDEIGSFLHYLLPMLTESVAQEEVAKVQAYSATMLADLPKLRAVRDGLFDGSSCRDARLVPMTKLLDLLRWAGVGLLIAAVVVALVVPEPEAEHILGLIGLGLILDGRLADLVRSRQ